jgi:hypothetical protein
MVEVQSQSDRSDLERMLVQAACAARLGHRYRKDTSRPTIITAIYIDNIGSASRYFLFVIGNNIKAVSEQVAHERC